MRYIFSISLESLFVLFEFVFSQTGGGPAPKPMSQSAMLVDQIVSEAS